jgi:hypothetical protein
VAEALHDPVEIARAAVDLVDFHGHALADDAVEADLVVEVGDQRSMELKEMRDFLVPMYTGKQQDVRVP